MTRTEAQTIIEGYIKANWSHTRLSFENIALATDTLTEYTRVNINFGKTKLISIKNCYRTTGVVLMSMQVKPGIATKRLLVLSDLGINLFLGQKIEGITFTDVNYRKDLREVSGFILGQVSAEFWFNTIKI